MQAEYTLFSLAFLLYAVGSWLILENFIRTSRLYRAGHDLALLYISIGCASTAVFCFLGLLLLPAGADALALTSPYLPLLLVPVLGSLLVAVVRYGDALVTAAAYTLVLALLANALLRFGAGRLVLPFAVMLLAVGLYQVGAAPGPARRLPVLPILLRYAESFGAEYILPGRQLPGGARGQCHH